MVQPYIQMYSTIMKCKNLGISINAADIPAESLDYVYEFYQKFEEVSSKTSTRSKKR